MRAQALTLRGVTENYILWKKEARTLRGVTFSEKTYAQSLRRVTMTCQNRKELGLVLDKWKTSR